MDPLAFLTAEEPSAQEQSAALAAAMRRQQVQGLALQALTGGAKAAPMIGASLAQNAQHEDDRLGQLAGQRLKNALANRQLDQQAAHQQRMEELAQLRLQVARTRGGGGSGSGGASAPRYQVVTGEGGTQYFVNPRSPTTPATPVVGPDGQPVVKPAAARPIPPSEKEALQELTGETRAVTDLTGRFEPDFAGGGPLGGLATSVYQKMGSVGSKNMQKDAAFWADFLRLIDLPQRNKVFGASLTSSEQSAWESAKNVRPGTSPELVRAKLAEMGGILQRKLSEHGRALLAEGFSPDAVGALTGGAVGGSRAKADTPATPADQSDHQQAKAWAEAHPNDPRAARIMAALKAKGL